MQADDFFSNREGLRKILTTFRETGHDLGMPESELAGLSSAAAALDSPLIVMLIGAKGSGKTSLIETLLGDKLSTLNNQSSESIIFWRYGVRSFDQTENDFTESYRPCSGLKEFEFIEVPGTRHASDPDLLRKAYLIADVVLVVFTATDPWDTESFDFISDLEIGAKRPVTSVITNTDQRTDEELQAIAEFVGSSGNKSLDDEIQVHQISSSGSFLNRSNDNKQFLIEWIIKSLEKRQPFVNRRARAELTLANATNQIAEVLENAVDTTKTEEEFLLSLDKLISLSQEEMMHDFAKAFKKDIDTLKNELRDLRKVLIKSNSLIGILFFIGSKNFFLQKRRILESMNKSITDHEALIMQKIEKHTKELDQCFDKGSSNVMDDTVLLSFNDSQEFSIETWCHETSNSAKGVLEKAIMESDNFKQIISKLRYSSLFALFTLLSASVSSWFMYSKMGNPFHGFSFVFLVIVGIFFILSIHMRRKVISLYDQESSAIRERIKEQLTELYSSPIEQFYKPYKDANLMLRNKYEERSCRRKISSICVSNALKTAKKILAKSLF